MIAIDERVEMLYGDLKDLGVIDFLFSREFKRMLKLIKFEVPWRRLEEQVFDNNSIFRSYNDSREQDSEEALITMLNKLMGDSNSVNFTYHVIVSLISYKKSKTNFDNLIDSLEVMEFPVNIINAIKEKIKIHTNQYIELHQTTTKVDSKDIIKDQKQRVFIVHGHNEGELNILARLLEKQGLKPIILKEQASKGMTIIEKFEANSISDFAIILLTGDDKGHQKNHDNLNLRARQNVIFEMGYFFALLGRENVICLQEKGIEVPSDLGGRMYIELDKSEAWKLTLIKELKTAGFDVTADKL